jgi:hypothetical protein
MSVQYVGPVPRYGGTVVELNPTNLAAAHFGVHGDDAEVYSFSFGVRSQWEFPHERRYRKGEKDILTEIEEMSRAVIAGRCKGRRGWFSLNGSISVGDYTYKITNLPMLPIPPFWTRSYAPYART